MLGPDLVSFVKEGFGAGTLARRAERDRLDPAASR